jgi:predicted acylesterase/phospholipase RssA
MDENVIWKPKVLILGPGGVKGFLTIGSLLFFEKSKLLKHIHKVVGISIGSVIGMFFCAGFTSTEILEIALSTQLSDVMTSVDLINVMKKNGLVSHDILRKKMEEKLIQKYGFVPTFQQFYMMTGIHFEVVVTNLDEDKAEYFSYLTEPDLSIIEAVLMSISLPLFFQSYKYKNKYYLDGAVADPFPIQKYKEEDTFGIFLKGSTKDSSGSFFQYLSRVIQMITSVQIKNMKIPPKCKILNLEHDTSDTIGMKMNFEQKVDLVWMGYVKAYQFYKHLYSKNPKEYPLFINKYHSIRMFESVIKETNDQKLIQTFYEYHSEIESECMEEEGDFYLEECFEDLDDDSEYFMSDEEEEEVEEEEVEEEEVEQEKVEEEEVEQEKVEGKQKHEDQEQEEGSDHRNKTIQLIHDVNEMKKQIDELVQIEKEIDQITSPKKNKYITDEEETLVVIDNYSSEEETITNGNEILIREEETKETTNVEETKETTNVKENKEEKNQNPIEQELVKDQEKKINEDSNLPKEEPFLYHKKKTKKGKKRKHHKPEWIKK